MSFSFAALGNDLYTGARSVPVVQKRNRFYLASALLVAIAVIGLVVQGLNLGLEFRGGSEFRVSGTQTTGDYEQTAREAVGAAEDQRGVNVTTVGNDTVRVQTERLSESDSQDVRQSLADAFEVPAANVSGTFIGPSWGASVSQQALRALIIFVLAVALTLIAVWGFARLCAGPLAAILAAFAFALTSSSPNLEGYSANAEMFMGFPAALAALSSYMALAGDWR